MDDKSHSMKNMLNKNDLWNQGLFECKGNEYQAILGHTFDAWVDEIPR